MSLSTGFSTPCSRKSLKVGIRPFVWFRGEDRRAFLAGKGDCVHCATRKSTAADRPRSKVGSEQLEDYELFM